MLTSDIDQIVTDANDNYALYQQTLNLDYDGYTVSTVITDFNTTDLELNNLIKGLISGDEHLSDLLVAEDGPGNTLIVRSLIDGVQAAADVSVSLTANTTIGAQSDNTINLFNAANNITDATPTLAELQTAVNNGLAAFNTENDYNDQLAIESDDATAENTTITFATNAANGTITATLGGLDVQINVTLVTLWQL